MTLPDNAEKSGLARDPGRSARLLRVCSFVLGSSRDARDARQKNKEKKKRASPHDGCVMHVSHCGAQRLAITAYVLPREGGAEGLARRD